MQKCGDKAASIQQAGFQPATLEWAKKLTAKDMAVIDGSAPYNRQAPKADIDNLKLLRGHLKQGQFITKIRKPFNKREMNGDLVFTRASSLAAMTTWNTSPCCPLRLPSKPSRAEDLQ